MDDVGGGSYRFAHALTRDAVYGAVGQSRRSELHRRAAASLEQAHGLEPGPELAAIALHLFAGAGKDDAERAVELAERAAAWALERDAYEQVVTLLTRALAVVPDSDVKRRRRVTRTRGIAYARLRRAVRRAKLGRLAPTRRRISAGVTSSRSS